MSSIATRTGDDGNTSLFGGGRVAKDNPRVEAYGNVDELNSWLGLARSERLDAETEKLLRGVQNDLFALGADLATPRDGNPSASKVAAFGNGPLAALDKAIEVLEARIAPLTNFILPGGSRAASVLHVA
jgi:cob(I)alamin adenosyltransferase